jgi:membrane protein
LLETVDSGPTEAGDALNYLISSTALNYLSTSTGFVFVNRTVRITEFVRSLAALVRDEQLSFLAAAIAYYAFVSLVPLVLLSIAVASAVAGQAFASQVISLFQEFLTAEAASLLEGALASARGRSSATIVGLAVLLWSGLRLFRGLDVAFSRVYRADRPVPLLTQVRNALVVLGGIGVALAATALLATVLPLTETAYPRVVGPVFLFAVLTATFFPLYYVFPDRAVTVREAMPGAVLAATGWVLLSLGFGIYADNAAAFQIYGVIGGVLLVLTWFYFGGLLVLLGAALNATLSERSRDRQVQQGPLREATQGMSESEEPPAGDENDGERESESDGDAEDAGVSTVEPESVDYADFAALRRELEELEEDVEERTVHRDDLESDLKRYVRKRVRRGHARGWGPYLVLLYGTIMTIGAFYFLSGGWAILAMLVIWLSTLGLYTLMVLVGVTFSAAGLPRRAIDRLRKLR